jgi:hypothetical protein
MGLGFHAEPFQVILKHTLTFQAARDNGNSNHVTRCDTVIKVMGFDRLAALGRDLDVPTGMLAGPPRLDSGFAQRETVHIRIGTGPVHAARYEELTILRDRHGDLGALQEASLQLLGQGLLKVVRRLSLGLYCADQRKLDRAVAGHREAPAQSGLVENVDMNDVSRSEGVRTQPGVLLRGRQSWIQNSAHGDHEHGAKYKTF